MVWVMRALVKQPVRFGLTYTGHYRRSTLKGIQGAELVDSVFIRLLTTRGCVAPGEFTRLPHSLDGFVHFDQYRCLHL